MLEATKGSYKYVYEKTYEHFILFRVEDEDGKFLFHETFRNVAEAQDNIKLKVDWGELIDQVDLNRTNTKDKIQEEINNLTGKSA